MIRILVKPAKRLFTARRQWTFEIRAANGERIDPRDTYHNRDDASRFWTKLITGNEPVELVEYDQYGDVEKRIELRT